MATIWAWLAGGNNRDTDNHDLRTALANQGYNDQSTFSQIIHVRSTLETILVGTNNVTVAMVGGLFAEAVAQQQHGQQRVRVRRIGSRIWTAVVFRGNETMDAFVRRLPQRYKVPNYTCVALSCDNFNALTETNLTDIVERGGKYVISPVYVFGQFTNIGHLKQNNFRRLVRDLMLELGVGGVVSRQGNQPYYDVSVWAPNIAYINEFRKRLVGSPKKKGNNQNDKPSSNKKNQNVKNRKNDNMSVVSNANANDRNNKNGDKNNKNNANNSNIGKNGQNDGNEEKMVSIQDNGKNDNQIAPIGSAGSNFFFRYEHPTVYSGETVSHLTRVIIIHNDQAPADNRLSGDDRDASSIASRDAKDIIKHFYV